MKKQLLLGSALLAAISAFPQNGRTKAQPAMVDIAQKVARKYQVINHPVEAPSPFQAPASTAARAANTNTAPANITSTVIAWNGFTGSENVYGMLVSTSKPLQYNDELGRVSFIHRKSRTYEVIPAAAATASTGVITAEITNNWGIDWDSTVLWSNDTYWARYPQGGIYNPPGNTLAKNAYVVGSGPVTQAVTSQGWVGNWFASRQLDTAGSAIYNNTIMPTQQTYVASATTTNAIAALSKVDFVRLDFSATDDGKVRSLGLITRDANNSTSGSLTSGYGYRGARIASAVCNTVTNNFTWTYNDSIIPSVSTNTTTNSKILFASPHMAWNESGTIGYVWHIGQRIGSTGNNIGYQPVVSKTTDGGATWTEIPGIDFNTPTMANDVLRWIPSVGTTTVTIPLFNSTEDMDGIVDANGKLHIVSTLLASSRNHKDSIGFSFQFPNSNDNQTYSFGHVPGLRPYIFDFVGDGTSPWQALMIDSMSSEAPGTAAADDGVDFNPWDKDPETGDKVIINGRIQLSRTPDGSKIVYTWAETDTVTNANQMKWNIAPNIKARLLTINGSVMTIHPNEINVTDPEFNQFAPVRGFAFNHYISPKCAVSTVGNGIAIFLPMTISSNPSLFQREPQTHYYASAVLNFDNLEAVQPPYAPDVRNGHYVGIAESLLNSAKNSVIYPNPAKGNAVVSIDLKDNVSTVEVSVMNMMGQQVKGSSNAAQIGQNNINVDLNGLSQGIYLVNVKVGTATSTKKLIVE